MTLTKSDFSYELPSHLIARQPTTARTASRLLVIGKQGNEHRVFRDLVDYLRPDDLLVVNDSEVVKARLHAVKDSGGRADLLVERIESEFEALCQVRVTKPLKPKRSLFCSGHTITVVAREGGFYRLQFEHPVIDFLEAFGSVPLPPYIRRDATAQDERRYQTVYASEPGAIAAPTAGLHFDEELLARIEAKGVRICRITLHVGAGTFQPVRQEDLSKHLMHQERYEIPAATLRCLEESSKRRIVSVGTTVVRTLETWAQTNAPIGETNLFIKPGFKFKVVDALITNFHLPESTLLMLVAAFIGRQRVLDAYKEAVAMQYRFFSYGDAMYLERRDV